MSFVTRGLGGPSHNLNTGGLGGILAVLVSTTGGRSPKYQVTARKVWLRPDKTPPALREKDLFGEGPVEIEVDGDVFQLAEGKWPTAKEAIAEVSPARLKKMIEAARKELGVTKKQAEKAIMKRAAKEIRAVKAFQKELVDDDEDFWIILMMSEV